MTATIQRLDGDYIVRLPANIITHMKMWENEIVQVTEEYGRIIIQKTEMATIANDPRRKTIDELFQGFEGDYEPVEIDWGEPVGKEIW